MRRLKRAERGREKEKDKKSRGQGRKCKVGGIVLLTHSLEMLDVNLDASSVLDF